MIDLNDATPEQALAWQDAALTEYDDRVRTLRAYVAKIKSSRTHAAEHARAVFGAELKRIAAVRAQREGGVSAREAARKAYRVALEAVRSHEANPLPDDVEAEMRRIAESNVLGRRCARARAEFVTACVATTLPPLPTIAHHEHVADAETAELASKWQRLKHYEPGRSNDALDLANTQGRTSDASVLSFYAVAEAEYGLVEQRALFAVRWEAIGRRHHLPAEEVDYESIARDAQNAEAAAE